MLVIERLCVCVRACFFYVCERSRERQIGRGREEERKGRRKSNSLAVRLVK